MVNVKFCVEECNVFDDYGKPVSRTGMTGERLPTTFAPPCWCISAYSVALTASQMTLDFTDQKSFSFSG
ncbi:MAG: hypothetical protein ACR5K9_01235 [Wolbachia sp.]